MIQNRVARFCYFQQLSIGSRRSLIGCGKINKLASTHHPNYGNINRRIVSNIFCYSTIGLGGSCRQWRNSSDSDNNACQSSSNNNNNTAINGLWEQMDTKTQKLAQTLSTISSTTSTKQLSKSKEQEEEQNDHQPQQEIFKRRSAVARAITLIESTSKHHQKQANLLLTYLSIMGQQQKQEQQEVASITSQKQRQPFRIGIAGAPGAGKSTFVEAFGMYLLEQLKQEVDLQLQKNNDKGKKTQYDDKDDFIFAPNKVAVVCIDPSSSITGGSILGDKTRMEELSKHQRAYVRPSPNKGVLGGLSAYTDDMVSLLQMAGYDLVMIETVGLGQSEIEVVHSVDMLLLCIPPGGGDDLQGIKKGILEVTDCLIVTKADGPLQSTAKHTAADYKSVVSLYNTNQQNRNIWEKPPVLLVSSYNNSGMDKVWETICKYKHKMESSGTLREKRYEQSKYWMYKNLQNMILEEIIETSTDKRNNNNKNKYMEEQLQQQTITPRVAAMELFQNYFDHANNNNNNK